MPEVAVARPYTDPAEDAHRRLSNASSKLACAILVLSFLTLPSGNLLLCLSSALTASALWSSSRDPSPPDALAFLACVTMALATLQTASALPIAIYLLTTVDPSRACTRFTDALWRINLEEAETAREFVCGDEALAHLHIVGWSLLSFVVLVLLPLSSASLVGMRLAMRAGGCWRRNRIRLVSQAAMAPFQRTGSGSLPIAVGVPVSPPRRPSDLASQARASLSPGAPAVGRRLQMY